MERKKEKKKKKRGKMDGDVVEGISNLFKATTRKKKGETLDLLPL